MSTESPTRPSQLTFERVAPIFALTFVDILGLTIILPLLHLYAIAFGASPLEVGMAAAAFPLAQIVGVPIMGALSDRFGRKPLLLISQVTTCLSFVMLALANSLWLVILSRVAGALTAPSARRITRNAVVAQSPYRVSVPPTSRCASSRNHAACRSVPG